MSTPLPKYHLAIEDADWSLVLTARRAGASWDSLRTRTGLSALGRAIIEGSAMTVEELLSMGAPTAAHPLKDGALFDPLWAAIEQGSPEVLALLLEAGADVDRLSPEGLHPLEGTEDAQKTLLLLEAGSNPNGSGTGRSPWRQWIEKISQETQEDAAKSVAVLEAYSRAGASVEDSLGSLPALAAELWPQASWESTPVAADLQALLSSMQARALEESTDNHPSPERGGRL